MVACLGLIIVDLVFVLIDLCLGVMVWGWYKTGKLGFGLN